MGIGDQFVGIDMKNLIGSPLSAAADASIFLAHSTANFINKVGFDENGATRNVNFTYEKTEPYIDGSLDAQLMKIDIPLLAIVPVPNLQIDEVNLLFDIEVKQYDRNDATRNFGSGLSGGAGFGPAKVSISGNVSTHSTNIRSSDNSAKYHLSVSACNHGIPEGLARVLDIMAVNISPVLLGRRAVDELGNELDEMRRIKNQKLRELSEKQRKLENSLNAAKEIFETRLRILTEKLESVRIAERFSATRTSANDTASLEELDTAWSGLLHDLRELVRLAAGNKAHEAQAAVSPEDYLPIPWAAPFEGEAKTETAGQIEELFKLTVLACGIYSSSALATEENRIEYNNLMIL